MGSDDRVQSPAADGRKQSAPIESVDLASHDLSRWMGDARSGGIRKALSGGGVRMTCAQKGGLKTRHFDASVTLEPDDVVRVRCPTTLTSDAAAALESCAGSAGNARFASGPLGDRLAADTRVNGAVHLPDSLKEIKHGFLKMLGKRVRQSGADAPDDVTPADAVRAVVDEAGWDSEQAVETDEGWELRPRLSGRAVPVNAVLTMEAVILRRTIVARMPAENAGRAVAHQALVMNDRLRGCRIAIVDGRLVAECSLRPALINIDWLKYTSLSVAAAARSVEPELKLLASEPAVAESYAELFLKPSM